MMAAVLATVLRVSSASTAQHSPAHAAGLSVRPVHLPVGNVLT